MNEVNAKIRAGPCSGGQHKDTKQLVHTLPQAAGKDGLEVPNEIDTA